MNVFAVSVVEVAAGGIVLAEVVADTIHHPARMGWGRCGILFPDNGLETGNVTVCTILYSRMCS